MFGITYNDFNQLEREADEYGVEGCDCPEALYRTCSTCGRDESDKF